MAACSEFNLKRSVKTQRGSNGIIWRIKMGVHDTVIPQLTGKKRQRRRMTDRSREAKKWRMETNFVINSMERSVVRQRARQVKEKTKKPRKEESVGRERHDWRMDRSRSGGEMERRGRRGGMDREEEIKERDIQRLASSSSTSLFSSSPSAHRSLFFFFFKRLHSRPVIDSS